MGPATVTQLLLTLLFVVPGFVYQSVRISVRGRLPQDVELPTRIVRAVMLSAIFGLVYVMILGGVLIDASRGEGYAVNHPRFSALVGLVGGIVTPAILALVKMPRWMIRATEKLPQLTKYDWTPTGWDKVFQDAEECFVRVLNRDGQWVAGYYGPNSYATSYPEPQQLFLERAYRISKNGVIKEPIENSLGVLIDCSALQLLRIVAPIASTPGTHKEESA